MGRTRRLFRGAFEFSEVGRQDIADADAADLSDSAVQMSGAKLGPSGVKWWKVFKARFWECYRFVSILLPCFFG